MDNWASIASRCFGFWAFSLVCYMPLARSSRARRIGLPSHPRSRGDTRADINRCGVAIAAVPTTCKHTATPLPRTRYADEQSHQ